MLILLALTSLLQATPSISAPTVARGSNSGVLEARTVIVRNGVDWAGLWKLHAGDSEPAPTIDFEKESVAAVFLGSRPTGGYSVEITGVRPAGQGVVIEFIERGPAPGFIVTEALTSPFHIVRIPRVPETESVVFRKMNAQ